MKVGLLFETTVFLLCFLSSSLAHSQQTSNNIVIKNATDAIYFEKTNAEQPVVVRHRTRVDYTCKEFQTSIPVSSFYSNQVQIDDVSILLNGKKERSIVPKYEYYGSKGIFFDDLYVCHFKLPFNNKGDISTVIFEKTTLDPRYLSTIYFQDDYKTLSKNITITIPDWLEAEIKEYNFKGFDITLEKTQKERETIYKYNIQNVAATKLEKSAPGPGYSYPHLMILVKKAKTKNADYVYFKTTKDHYTWSHRLLQQVENDTIVIKKKTLEITTNKNSDEEKVKSVYQWVQQNIRYIAYEDGIAAFKPEKAQEVLRKKYGDCKGMANLLTQMLRSIGLDARLCWIGTNHIPYDHSTPSLSVDNHMISVWIHDGKFDFMDGTEKYIGFGEIAERIQGREAMIEDGENFLLKRVPVTNFSQNTCFEKRVLSLEGNNLVGHITHIFKGESKESFLALMDNTKTENQQGFLVGIFKTWNPSFSVANIKTSPLSDNNGDLRIEYDVFQHEAFTVFGNDKYLDIENNVAPLSLIVDTTERHQALVLPFKNHIVLDVEISLPKNSKVQSLPGNIKIDRPGYQASGYWSLNGDKLLYKSEFQLANTWIAVSDFPQWNADLKQLKDFYNLQAVLTL